MSWESGNALGIIKRDINHALKHFAACEVGTYGENCSNQCGHCFETEQCHHINGTCMNGCDSGFHGLLCTDGKHVLIFSVTIRQILKCILKKHIFLLG